MGHILGSHIVYSVQIVSVVASLIVAPIILALLLLHQPPPYAHLFFGISDSFAVVVAHLDILSCNL